MIFDALLIQSVEENKTNFWDHYENWRMLFKLIIYFIASLPGQLLTTVMANIKYINKSINLGWSNEYLNHLYVILH